MAALAHSRIEEPIASQRLRCTFCGKNDSRVRFLVAGRSGGTICNTCCFLSLFIFLRAYVASLLKRDS